MLGIHHDIDEYLSRLRSELDGLNRAPVRRLSALICEAWEKGSAVFVFGNGGSGATASHVCEDLNKGALRGADLADESKHRPRVLSLTDNTSWMTAIGNDMGFEHVFVQPLMHWGRPGDLVVAISGSGNSRNVLLAVDWANRHGLKTFGLTGYDGGRLKQIQQDGLHVPLDDMGIVESIHLSICHWVVDDLHAWVNQVERHVDR